MSRDTFEVNWAKELGIDVPRLKSEHPYHPFQLRNKKSILTRAERYWDRKAVEQMWERDGIDFSWLGDVT